MSGLPHRCSRGLYSERSDKELVERCQNDEREAWNEFFYRFIPDIKDAIIQRLRAFGHSQIFQQDIVWQIHEQIVFDLIRDKKLKLCKDPSGIRAWLRTLASNRAVDWIRKYGAKKRLPERVSERTMLSLDTPIDQDNDLTLGDVIAAEPPSNAEIQNYLASAVTEICATSEMRGLWVLRLSVLSQFPLCKEELVKLTGFSGFSMEELTSRLAKIMARLTVMEKKRNVAEQVAILYWYQIRYLEAICLDRSREASEQTQKELEALECRIREIAQLRHKHLRRAQRLCRPSNRDIATLVGISEENAANISTLLIRARSMLKKRLKNFDVSSFMVSDS